MNSKESASKAASSKSKKTAQKKKQDITSEKEEEVQEATEFASETPELEKNLEEQTEKAREWHDKYLRLSAEFDNYRKRTLKEKSDLIKTANEDLLIDILAVVDDFERGINTIDKSEDLQALKAGIHLIYDKFNAFLRQKGIKEIEAKEKEFDLDLHEALTKIPAPDETLKGKVVDVIEKGYTLNEKVIRFAKVVVGD
ncbi:MAG: nucleotide exchange factor GrpE [Bacteroidales bacterium]|nr:nucleotide exchange factor GrpE [Bacteroidales bacterium]